MIEKIKPRMLLPRSLCQIAAAQPAPAASRDIGVAEVRELPPAATRWALVVGVDDYHDKRITSLDGAANDAAALARTLVSTSGFPEDQVAVLSSSAPPERQPSRANILFQLSNLAELVPKDGLFVFFFAGHGVERERAAYLMPSDARLTENIRILEATGIPVNDVRSWILDMGIKQVLVFLDACRNDPSAGRGSVDNLLSDTVTSAFDFNEQNRGVEAFAVLYGAIKASLPAAQFVRDYGTTGLRDYGTTGLRLDNPTHEAHFDSAFRSNFGPLNSAIATQLTLLPIPSPASGFTYEFDAEPGVYPRSEQSLGPILAERAETIGKGKFSFGTAHQNFSFDSLADFGLGNIPSVFEHQPAANPVFERDVITTSNFIDFQLGQTTLYFSYGVSSRVDISIAAPLVRAKMSAVSLAEIQRIGTFDDPDLPHTFNQDGDETAEQFSNGGSASGLGDVTVRVKGNVYRGRRMGVALGVDARLPTGDEYDFLGSGAYGLRPFAVVSFNLDRVSPHVNFSY